MLREGLTVEQARSELQGECDVYDWRMVKNDPFVVALREIVDIRTEGVRNGVFDNRGRVRPGFEGGEDWRAWDLRRRIFLERFKFMNDYRVCDKWDEWIIDFYDSYGFNEIFTTVFEQVANAVEHGSDWCRAGDVVLRTELAVNGLLAVIDQPSPGPDYGPFLADPEGILRRGALLYPDSVGVLRGLGMSKALGETRPWIWGHELGGGGYRTIILETKERILRLDRVSRF